MTSVVRDQGRVVALSPQRERRLLKMARTPGFNHKAFYSQYCFLMGTYVTWCLGTAFLTADGETRLAYLEQEAMR